MTGLQMVGSAAAACEGDACLIPQPPAAGKASASETSAAADVSDAASSEAGAPPEPAPTTT